MFLYINAEKKNRRFTCETDPSAHRAVRFPGQNLDLFLQQQICKTIHDSISGSLTIWNVFICWFFQDSFSPLMLSYHDISQVFFSFQQAFFSVPLPAQRRTISLGHGYPLGLPLSMTGLSHELPTCTCKLQICSTIFSPYFKYFFSISISVTSLAYCLFLSYVKQQVLIH